MQQIGGRSPPSICCNLWESKFYKYSKERAPGGSGDRCTLPWEGRVTGPLNLQSFLSRRFDDVHQIEALSKLPGRVVPSLPGSLGLDLDTYKILTSHKLQQIGEGGLLPICLCNLGSQNFIVFEKERAPGGSGDRCTLPWEGRVTGP